MAQRIDLSQLELLQTLGTGAYGRVRLARRVTTGELIAIKALKKAEILRLKQVDHVMSEFSILRTIRHPFLVNLIGYTQDERHLYFAIEYVPGGELFTYLRQVGRIDCNSAKLYTAQVTLMFEYLHSLNIVYRDLKPENLLIGSDGYLKLIDFGFSKLIESKTYTLCGTPEYLAPEVLLNKGHGRPVDWWALGVFVYELVTGFNPFADEEPMFIYQKVLLGKLRFPKTFDSNVKSLVKHLLVADVGRRYGSAKNGINDIKNHRWFAGFDWGRLAQKAADMPYRPIIKSPCDTSHYSQFPEYDIVATPVRDTEDPFIDW